MNFLYGYNIANHGEDEEPIHEQAMILLCLSHVAILGLWWVKPESLRNFSIVGCQWTVNRLLGW